MLHLCRWCLCFHRTVLAILPPMFADVPSPSGSATPQRIWPCFKGVGGCRIGSTTHPLLLWAKCIGSLQAAFFGGALLLIAKSSQMVSGGGCYIGSGPLMRPCEASQIEGHNSHIGCHAFSQCDVYSNLSIPMRQRLMEPCLSPSKLSHRHGSILGIALVGLAGLDPRGRRAHPMGEGGGGVRNC